MNLWEEKKKRENKLKKINKKTPLNVNSERRLLYSSSARSKGHLRTEQK